MAKLTWNAFVAKHPNPYGILVIDVPSKFPPAYAFDRAGKKLPTPYALFQQWAAATFVGDWSSQSGGGGFYLGVETLADVHTAQAKFGGKGGWITSKFSKNVLQITYDWNAYKAVAAQFGYTL